MKQAASPAIRCESIERLAEREFLGRLLGPVRSVERVPMGTPGFSGSTHARLDVALADGTRESLVLKHTRLDRDFTAYRSGDVRGREAMLLATPELARVWEVFESPYLAWATGPGEHALLMRDLGAHVLPDAREPVAVAVEDTLLDHLARLHAAYWNAAPSAPWLASPGQLVSLVGPAVLEGADPDSALPSPLKERVEDGWTEAFRRLPDTAARQLRLPALEHERRWAHLPRTLVHGDSKVANFAFPPRERVSAFDWALVGAAPISIELGWYLTVNASRLARPRDAVIARYRELLEAALGRTIDEPAWTELVDAAVVSGAVTLLWSKALALRDGRPGAESEWAWWVAGIERATAR